MDSCKPRILCVEDNKDTYELLRATLQPCCFELTPISTMAEGFGLARNSFFDLFFIDNSLPDGTAIELCRKIRTFNLHTPILFFSAAAFKTGPKQALDAGAQAYVTDSVDSWDLEQTVVELIRGAELKLGSAARYMSSTVSK